MKRIQQTFILIILSALLFSCSKSNEDTFEIVSGNTVAVFYLSGEADQLIEWAVNDLADDIEFITGKRPEIKKTDQYDSVRGRSGIYVGKYDDLLMGTVPGIDPDEFSGQWEKFSMVIRGNDLVLAGSDTRGTVYAVFELAERLGISPWKWWADVTPEKRDKLVLLLPGGQMSAAPSVRFRGIFLNDEDWGLQPWASKTFEPETGDIGPKTYEKIFQLLLRLKANTIWPAMHDCTQAFFTIPGNQEMARKYRIVIGTSHAEPMLRDNVWEWKEEERGKFNYFTNRDQVNSYWRERIEELDPEKDLFMVTVGMRGVHDSRMEGATTMEEQVEMLERIITNQRRMLEELLDKPANEIPQAFIPYKEVLDIYNAGLKLPEDISLVWTDDNYGYIRRLSDESEQERTGGSGIYYHLSYWGRPHDYLWLSTTQPGLIWFEMTRAYMNGAGRIWIANVGDIKPAEYNMEFFLDLAWDIGMVNEENINNHMVEWAEREFGHDNARDIAGLMEEYYRLAFLRKPEFMGWSQTEPTTGTRPTAFNPYANGNELKRRIDEYKGLYEETSRIAEQIPPEKQAAYFQLIEYPVKGAALMNFKFLYAQLAGDTEDPAGVSLYRDSCRTAYEEIEQLTDYYNNKLLNGKWKFMMDMKPRRLPVFDLPEFSRDTFSLTPGRDAVREGSAPVFIQAAAFKDASGSGDFNWKVLNGLGYSNRAVTLMPLRNESFKDTEPYLAYRFELDQPGRYEVEVRCLPTHANHFDQRLGIAVDNAPTAYFPLNTEGRSEAWKQNVLRNFQPVRCSFTAEEAGRHTLTLSVNRTGIVIDQIAVIPDGYPDFYEIPVISLN